MLRGFGARQPHAAAAAAPGSTPVAPSSSAAAAAASPPPPAALHPSPVRAAPCATSTDGFGKASSKPQVARALKMGLLDRLKSPKAAAAAPAPRAGGASGSGTAARALSREPLSQAEIEQLIIKLNEIEAVKFGEFTLKSGLVSPVYVDLRVIVSYPDVLEQVARTMHAKLAEGGAQFDLICGVPYTALPIATCMSLAYNLRMCMRRKEVKDYGTKKAIEGAYSRGERCLIVEDLVTSGASVAETVAPLNEAGLSCTDVVVLIDREQGAEAHLNKQGLRLHAAFKLTHMLDVLVRHGKADQATADRVRAFLAANQTAAAVAGAGAAAPAAAAAAGAAGVAAAGAAGAAAASASTRGGRLPYEERAKLAKCPTARACLELMARKRTNLSVAADVATADEMLALADAVGPHVCVFKTHVDIFDKWDASIAAKLSALADKHDFLIFEDRKFADIGNTVASQYSGGVYRIADWSHLTNAHLVPGPGIIDGLKQVGLPKGRGLLLLAEMSSKGTLAAGGYTRAVAAAAEASPDFVMGFISINPAAWPGGPGSPGLIHMTPGVQLSAGGDALGQQYLTPEKVIGENGSDVIIVGRGVIKAADPAAAAAQYREAGWRAYEASLAAAAKSK